MSEHGFVTRHADLIDLAESNLSLFKNSQYSDLTIRCGTRTWAVHKAIVCARSVYFAKACDGNFKEASENYVTLHEDNPIVVDAMLEFLYTADYNDGVFKNEAGKTQPFTFNVLVHTISDKYNLPALSRLACQKFHQLANGWRTPEFAAIVEDIYNSPIENQELRRRVVLICADNAKELFAKPAPDKTPLKLVEFIRRTPGFAADLAAQITYKLQLAENKLTVEKMRNRAA